MNNLLDSLEKKYEFEKKDYFQSGWKASTYLLNQDKIVKIPMKRERGESDDEEKLVLKSEDKFIKKLSQEYLTHIGFYNFFKGRPGINIVKPYGLFALKCLDNQEYFPGLVTRFLDGILVQDFIEPRGEPNPLVKDYSPKEKKLIVSICDNQIKQIKNFGVESSELGYENSMWVPKEGKVYMFDLDGWKFQNEEVLNSN